MSARNPTKQEQFYCSTGKKKKPTKKVAMENLKKVLTGSK